MALKVLIVSSYGINCGVASYSEVLKTLLETAFEVTIAPLDQALLKRTEGPVVATGDQQIKQICESFKNYDVVNLQWEPGLLGGRALDQVRRFKWLIDAADHLILTVHTVVPYPDGRRPLDFLRFVRKKGLRRAYQFPFHGSFERRTYKAVKKRSQSGRPFMIATHTQRERDFFKHVVGVKDVFDHPLCHLQAGWPARLAKEGPVARSELAKQFPNKTLIGVFGFLSEYKGIMTAVKAMKHLGDDYQLLIYGGIHPETVKPYAQIAPYIRRILAALEGRQEPNSQGAEVSAGSGALLDKVTFLGAPPSDYDFALAVSAVDICLFPYVEVGQSGSGPASHAIELGKPTILTRTRAFVELGKYFPEQFAMIDIGNYIELAQTAERLRKKPLARLAPEYNSLTLMEFYEILIECCASGISMHGEDLSMPSLLSRLQSKLSRSHLGSIAPDKGEAAPVSANPDIARASQALAEPALDGSTARTIQRALAKLEGWCSERKALWLADLISAHGFHQVLEVGIYGGRSLIPMAIAIKNQSGDGKVVGVEAWNNEVAVATATNQENDAWWQAVDLKSIKASFFRNVVEHNLTDVISVLEMSSDAAYRALGAIEAPGFDLIHVDGSHAEEQALQDVISWSSLVRPGGMLVLDDISWPTVQKARGYLRTQFETVAEVFESPGVAYGAYRRAPDKPEASPS